MDQDFSPKEAERRARGVAHRMLTTPPTPQTKPKRKPAKPARERASKPGKRGRAA